MEQSDESKRPAETEQTESHDGFSVNRRKLLLATGGAVVGIGVGTGSASAHTCQDLVFYGCSQVCSKWPNPDTQSMNYDYAVVWDGSNHCKVPIDERTHRQNPTRNPQNYCSGDLEYAVVGACTPEGTYCKNPNDCADNYPQPSVPCDELPVCEDHSNDE